MNLNRFLPRLCCSALGLSALMAFSASVSAYDFSSQDRNGIEIFYNINPDGKTVTVTYGSEKYNTDVISVPENVTNDGTTYTVTAIGNKAFERSRIKGISLPNSIKEIQQYAFYLSSVESINYPSSLKYVRLHAFEGTPITNGILPDGLSIIEDCAFAKTKINVLSLPNTLKEIGSSAFYSCYNIAEVTIPGSVKVVRSSAFSSCPSLKKVVIEEGVEELENGAFYCGMTGNSLEEVVFPSTLTKIGSVCFYSSKIKDVVLPNTIKEIGSSCFQASHEMESITFSSGMEELPNDVCRDCSKLIKVNIPEGITKIGNNAFSSTPLLSHITIPESVIEIGVSLFSASGIVDFTFPKNLTYLSNEMFYECDNLTEVTVPETIKNIGNKAFCGCGSLRIVSLPEALESLGELAFYGCSSLEKINIPSKLNKLEKSTFSSCKNLTRVVIPEGVKDIDGDVFRDCTNLAELKLPKSLEKIGPSFISGCENIRELTIYHQVGNIAHVAFKDCKNLEKIHLHRAVVPTAHIITNPWSPVIPADNNCTLYVPKGSAETYRASQYWNTFKAIEEEEITEELNYQFSFPSSISGGSLTVNGEKTKNVMEFAMNSNVVITAEPKNGYHLAAFTLNGKDVTAEMTDGSYVIEKLDANYVVDAKFAENPVKLSLFMAVGGSVDVEIEKRATFSCFITPEEGWKVNTVTFNGRDVTSDLTDDKRYTTPSLTGDSELRVTFENVNSAVENIGVNATSTKVYVDRSGLVTIEGIESGTVVSAYAVNGQLVERITSSGDVATLQLYQHGIYLIQTPVKTYKIHY
ncbi:leucine-rich repeat domain-containing protein [uncultured Duncaniella sp.]|uniref:leucine-rich repeat domain-containing protein n=1 Tax=uncultured Duncaniella sp. TaxID=2768039 RepID=UPI00272A17ED|nr:leucine-rich repeat domain-containing protein [uncultured Duncaniella sp.]